MAPRSRLLAVVSGGRVHLWLPSDDTVEVLGEPTSVVTTVAWSGTGDRLAGGHFDVRVWGPVEARWGVLGSHTGQVTGMAWAPDGDRLATAGGDNEVQIWDVTAAGADAAPRRRPGWIRAVAVSRDGGRVATLGGEQGGTSTSPVHVCEVVDGLAITATAPTTGGDQALAWSGASAVDRTTMNAPLQAIDRPGSACSTIAGRGPRARQLQLRPWDRPSSVRDRHGRRRAGGRGGPGSGSAREQLEVTGFGQPGRHALAGRGRAGAGDEAGVGEAPRRRAGRSSSGRRRTGRARSSPAARRYRPRPRAGWRGRGRSGFAFIGPVPSSRSGSRSAPAAAPQPATGTSGGSGTAP